MGTKEVLVTKFRKHAFPGYTEMHMYPKKKKSPVPPLQQEQCFISSGKYQICVYPSLNNEIIFYFNHIFKIYMQI